MDRWVNRRIGGYLVKRLLGAGSFGRVYLCHNELTNRSVAAKILPRASEGSEDSRRRVIAEYQALDALRHTHIVSLFDVQMVDEAVILLMEYLEGDTLLARLQRGSLHPEEVGQLAHELSSALAHAHLRGIIHRDVKPANIVLTKEGAKLLDFGVARLASIGPQTQPGIVIGTIAYLAPERLGGHPPTPADDIFALGVCLYEALAGTACVLAPGHGIESRLHPTQLPDIDTVNPALPPWLSTVIRTCLQADPKHRYGDGAALLAAVRPHIDLSAELGISAGPGVNRSTAQRPTRSRRPMPPPLLVGALSAPTEPHPGPSPAPAPPASASRRMVAFARLGAMAVGLLLVLCIGALVWRAMQDPAIIVEEPTYTSPEPTPAYILELDNQTGARLRMDCAHGSDGTVVDGAVEPDDTWSSGPLTLPAMCFGYHADSDQPVWWWDAADTPENGVGWRQTATDQVPDQPPPRRSLPKKAAAVDEAPAAPQLDEAPADPRQINPLRPSHSGRWRLRCC